MGKTSKDLLQLENNDPSSSSLESALLVCKKGAKLEKDKPKLEEGKPFSAPLPKSQVLGKVKDFLGVISEANKSLQLNATDKPDDYDIEVLNGNESEYIEMDLMLGVADLHTPDAVSAAKAAASGNPPILTLPLSDSSTKSESSSDDDYEDSDYKEETEKTGSLENGESKSEVDGSQREGLERPRKKRPKIVELL